MTTTGRNLRWRLFRAAAFFLASSAFMAPTFGLVPPVLFRNDSLADPKATSFTRTTCGPAWRDRVLHDRPHFQLTWLMKTVEGVAGDVYAGTRRWAPSA